MYYCILRSKKKENTAGMKAPDDIVTICQNNGFKIVHWGQLPTESAAWKKKLWLTWNCNKQWISLLKKCKKGDMILYQHPSYGYKVGIYWVQKLQKKGVRCIALTHDLEILRKGVAGLAGYNEKRSELADITFLQLFDAVICHNDCMKEYMISRGFLPEKLYSLEIFDYVAPFNAPIRSKGTQPSISIAGNLSVGKCPYIYRIFDEGHNLGLTVNLYGINYQEMNSSSSLIYHGAFSPEELPQKLAGDFGLVWDGPEATTCGGGTGAYLKYNNPHKTSLYLSAGMPVIIWRQAAIAAFVQQQQVGILVDSLYEIENRIKNITMEEYGRMAKNAARIGNHIREGYYTMKAVNSVIHDLDKER